MRLSTWKKSGVRFDRFEERFEARLDQMQRTYMATVVGSMTALTAIFSLVVGFHG